MGLWWKDIVADIPEDEGDKVTFEGDPKARSKHWPILWRFCQNWQIIMVVSEKPCKIFFQSATGRCMQYRKPISTMYVAVRVGPEATTFWAVSDEDGTLCTVHRMNISFPGLFRKEWRPFWQRHDNLHYKSRATFI